MLSMRASISTALWAVGAGIAVTAVVALVLATGPENSWLPVAAIVAPLLLLASVRSRLQIVPLSPVWLIAIVVAIVGVGGYLLADQLAGQAGGGIIISLPVADRPRTAYVYAASVLAFCVGAMIASLFTGKRDRLKLTAVRISPAGQRWMNVLATVPLVMILTSLGATIITRDVYLAGADAKAIFGLGQQLATATVALLGYLVVAARGGRRLVAFLLTIGYFGVFFSLGSRRLALLPIVFVIGMLMAKPTRIWLKLIVAGTISAVVLPLPLFLRGQQEHGLTPYVDALGGYSLSDVDWLTTVNNVLISFPTTGLTAFHVERLPLDYLWISLNPIPGEDAGWYQIASSMTLNRWTPFSTVGELWNYGILPAVLVWGGLGVVALLLDRAVGTLWEGRIPFVSLAVIGLSALFALQALQYNLRSSSRMLVYAVAVAIAGTVYIRLRDGARSARDAREADTVRRNGQRRSLPAR